MKKRWKLTFLSLKTLPIILSSPSLGCEYLDLFLFVESVQQHSSWHLELLRMHSLMN